LLAVLRLTIGKQTCRIMFCCVSATLNSGVLCSRCPDQPLGDLTTQWHNCAHLCVPMCRSQVLHTFPLENMQPPVRADAQVCAVKSAGMILHPALQGWHISREADA
jgi:hypothetical protein